MRKKPVATLTVIQGEPFRLPNINWKVLAYIAMLSTPLVAATVIYFWAFPYGEMKKAVNSNDYQQVTEFNPVVFFITLIVAIAVFAGSIIVIVIETERNKPRYHDYFGLVMMALMVAGCGSAIVFALLSSLVYPNFNNSFENTVPNAVVTSDVNSAVKFADTTVETYPIYSKEVESIPFTKNNIIYEYYRHSDGRMYKIDVDKVTTER